MTYTFHPEAAHDLFDIMDRYEAEREGLGLEFHAQMSRTIDHICWYPASYPDFELGSKRALLKQFPFAVVYRAHPSTIETLAIIHTRQDPQSILDRLR